MTGQLGRLQAPATGELIDLSERTGVKNLFVAQDHSLEQLLFDRTVVGSEFAKHCLDGSRFLIGCIDRAWLARPTTAELVLLSKGLAYQMSTAALLEVGVALPINLVATRRVDASSEDALIEIPYHRFDAGGSDLVIADTVASGASICRALDEYRLDHPVETITVLSFAGSLMGARRIERYCDAEGISACFVFALAAFGLADNGFDLSFLHADTIADPAYVERAAQQFGGQPVSAVGWDFGSQSMAPDKYARLSWVEAEIWGMHAHPQFAHQLEPETWAEVRLEAAAYRDLRPDLPIHENRDG